MPSVLNIKEWAIRAARLMVGIPDYQTYVEHRRACHPNERIMNYQEFFEDRQDARFGNAKGKIPWVLLALPARTGIVLRSHFRDGRCPRRTGALLFTRSINEETAPSMDHCGQKPKTIDSRRGVRRE